jgi:hypothetical protein
MKITMADCLQACRLEVLARRESYRATGGALSRQSRSRKCANPVLRRRSCKILPRFNACAGFTNGWDPGYRLAPADLHFWNNRLTKGDCHHRRPLDQHCSSYGTVSQSQAGRQHVHVSASLPRRGLGSLYRAYHLCWRDGEHWEEIFAQDILERSQRFEGEQTAIRRRTVQISRQRAFASSREGTQS